MAVVDAAAADGAAESQTKSEWAVRRCIARVDVWRYVLPQLVHTYGFLWVWTTWCLYKLEYSVKRLPQSSDVQIYGFSPADRATDTNVMWYTTYHTSLRGEVCRVQYC